MYTYGRRDIVMKFLKGSRDQFDRLKDDVEWGAKAEIIQQQMAEVFGSKNLSFLMGSGCSSFKPDKVEFGIPTMRPLASEFQELMNDPDIEPSDAFVTLAQKTELLDKIGINLSAEPVAKNLEQMMAVLMNAQQFCSTSEKKAPRDAVSLIDEVIVGLKKFILKKCTAGNFSEDDQSVVLLYQRFYQSLNTRARGLSPPWVFTTNYDLFNERAMDRSGVPYSNGFSGTIERKFNPASYRLALAEQLDISSRRWAAVDGYVHFCKLHGSVNWIEEEKGLFPIREIHSEVNPSDNRVMIYPTPSKQTASFGSPYSDMFREFQRQIVQDQSVLVVAGFSFGDEHVNNIIFQGLTLPSFKLIAFLDPETNDITRNLAALGDPRIWFIWGDGSEDGKKAHYFESIVKDLMPSSADQKINAAVDAALQLLTKQEDESDGAR